MADPYYEARKEVARANRSFYRAFERQDPAAMRAIWLDSPTVKCIHPGGQVLSGIDRVQASWEAIFENTEGIRFDLADLDIQIEGGVAWVLGVERIRSSSSSSPGQPLLSEMAGTNLFVRRDGDWKLVLHHASPISRRFSP